MHTALLLTTIIVMTVAVNIPLGFQRQGCRKFSFGWYFYVHISIPVIIYARIKSGLGWQGLGASGQGLGTRD